jgi:fructose-1,6-bisphosphatase I
MAYKQLDAWLKEQAGDDALLQAVAETINNLATAAAAVSRMVARGPLNPGLEGKTLQEVYAYFDSEAGNTFVSALKDSPVAQVAREKGGMEAGTADAPLAVTLDALNGSSNIDANTSPGTLFGIWPAAGEETFSRPGVAMAAAGFFIYGPRTALAFSIGRGTQVATLDPESGVFYVTAEKRELPEEYAREYAVNASNYRFWDPAIRTYVDDMIDGADGPREVDYNMRWSASLVADALRVLNRGGIFLYPADARPGYGKGRMKLVFHACPVAMVMEQAGGMATDGKARILEKTPGELHERTPLIFGSSREVERVRKYYELPLGGSRSPLFSRRGLFRF